MSLNTEIAAIAALVKAPGVQSYTAWPGNPSIPSYVVVTSDPYLESGSTFGKFKMHAKVVVVVGAANSDNTVPASKANDLTEDAIVALVNAGYGIENVSGIVLLTGGATPFATIQITTNKEISL